MQANILYEKTTELPPFHTPTGIMFLLVWKMRQTIEFQKSRSLIQAMMSQQGAQDENIKKVFDDLKEAFFPFDKNQKSAELKKMRQAMDFWVKHGPVAVEAQDDGSQKKKIASRLLKGQQSLKERAQNETQGKATQLDPYTKAKRRSRAQ